MLRALAEAGVVPELVVGSSVGAVNGAMVAHDPEKAHERLTEIWLGVRRRDIFPGGLLHQARTLVFSRTHLFPLSGLRRLLERHIPVRRVEDLTVRFAPVATDAQSGHGVPLTAGPLVPAVLASAAIPGVFPHIVIDGRTYIDGGVASNVPMPQALDLGAGSLVVVDPGFPCHRPDPPRTLAETLLFSGAILLRQHALCGVPGAASRVPVVYLPAPCPQGTSPFDFSRTAELVETSYESAARFLGDLRVDGPGLYGQPHAHEEATSARPA